MRFSIRAAMILMATGVMASAAMAQGQLKKTPPAAHTAPPAEVQAIIHTSVGDIQCTIFTGKVPQAAANFIALATGEKEWTDPVTKEKKHGVPFYDGTTFHRVIPGFMIQGGDRLGTGEGDAGYSFQDEYTLDLKFDKPGTLAYANSGPNTNGSQFFITEAATSRLNPCLDGEGCVRSGKAVPPGYGYTIFGQCGQPELVQKIARVERDANDKPLAPIVINHVEIVGHAAAPKAGRTRLKPRPIQHRGN
jgi:peptidyl-prolyl cis-trans isomerase A (cyclophilin A)